MHPKFSRNFSSELISFSDPVVLRAKEFIHINSGFSIRVSDVAKHLRLSRRIVEIRFRKALGYTILEEIQRVRMEAIRRLVAQTETPFGKIAELSGLDSAGHLGEIFKKEFDMTMGEYRKSHAAQ